MNDEREFVNDGSLWDKADVPPAPLPEERADVSEAYENEIDCAADALMYSILFPAPGKAE